MSYYPKSDHERRIAFPDLSRVVSEIFRRCDMSHDDAALLADTLVVADAQAVHSHGVIRVPEYVAKLTEKGVDPRGTPRVVHTAPGAIVVDGGNSMGQIGAAFATRRALEAARTQNVVFAAIRGSNHCGALSYFTRLALPEDMIAICASNALPTMAPWGGLDKILGMNPLSIAIPAGAEPPIVFDAAFAASSHGKIRVYDQKGHPIPPGWAWDADGQPTTDAAQAMRGLLQPIGEHKGTALALAFGILSTLLSGAAYGNESGNMNEGARPGVDGHFVLVLRIGAFVEPDVFKRRVDGIVRAIRSSRTAPGVDRIWVPGEMEAETERRTRAEGIPLNQPTLDGLREVARAMGVDATALV